MLDGFGLTPVRIQLDLDSYEGPWTHIERFRGRSGWLAIAEAHLTSGSADWVTTIVAACDEYGEGIPGFMAPNLLACACSLPALCEDFPPDELESLLSDAAAVLKLQWLRDSNAGLARLSDAAIEQIAALEAQTMRQVDELDRRIADIRRRLRMPCVSSQAREAFGDAIIAFESERDAVLTDLVERRTQLRRAVADEERALIGRTHVEVEVDPLYYLAWSASPIANEDQSFARWYTTAISPSLDRGLRAYERSAGAADLRTAMRHGRYCPDPPSVVVRDPTVAVGKEPVATVLTHVVEPASPLAPSTPAPPARQDSGETKKEQTRKALRRELDALEATGRKFFPGSRKYIRNQEQRAHVEKQLAAMDGRAMAETQAAGGTTPDAQLCRASAETALQAERSALLRRLEAVEADRRRFMTHSAPYQRRTSQCEALAVRLAELDARIAEPALAAKAGV